jgi:hypothetical protein
MKKSDTHKMIQLKIETYDMLKKIQNDFTLNTRGKISLDQIINDLLLKNNDVQ